MNFIYSFGCLLFTLQVAVAKPLPPLGKRKYLLDTKRPERPAQIEGIEAPASELDRSSSAGMMKDPIPMGNPTTAKKAKAWTEPRRVELKTSKMKFEKVAIAGRYAVPRVSFEQERQEIKHVDEPVKQDYQRKAQESDQLLKDLNW